MQWVILGLRSLSLLVYCWQSVQNHLLVHSYSMSTLHMKGGITGHSCHGPPYLQQCLGAHNWKIVQSVRWTNYWCNIIIPPTPSWHDLMIWFLSFSFSLLTQIFHTVVSSAFSRACLLKRMPSPAWNCFELFVEILLYLLWKGLLGTQVVKIQEVTSASLRS